MTEKAKVRYIVSDVAAAVEFYRGLLGFEVDMQFGPGFAMLSRGPLQLLMNAPGAGGAGAAMPDGALPQPGGWNRIQIDVEDLDGRVGELRRAGATFRNEIVQGNGGRQILVEDPSGNLVELFQPAAR
jgi:catechol 2,3-dioxygenase-like lactoylglutathione lyase family enzyme